MLICTFCWNLRQIVKSALISGETVLNYSVILKFIWRSPDYTAGNFRGQKQLIDLYAFQSNCLSSCFVCKQYFYSPRLWRFYWIQVKCVYAIQILATDNSPWINTEINRYVRRSDYPNLYNKNSHEKFIQT